MTGSSSTWYAISARFSSSRSSAARSCTELEMLKQLLRRLDDSVRSFRLEERRVVDTAPCDGDRVQPARLGSANVERRVADVRRVVGTGAEPLEREQQRLGIRLVALGLVAADDDVEEMSDRHARERKRNRRAPLRRDDAEPPPLVAEPEEPLVHPDEDPDLVVQGLVVP